MGAFGFFGQPKEEAESVRDFQQDDFERGKRSAMYVDRFTSLDDIKGRDESNALLVLASIIKNGGCFSVFDATRNVRMARTMRIIESSGWTKRVEPECSYPWIKIELTDAGKAALARD
jgi:hypothetical protein